MIIRPISIRDADKFVSAHHRHNKAAANGKFAIDCWHNEKLIGVGIGGCSPEMLHAITPPPNYLLNTLKPNNHEYLYVMIFKSFFTNSC